jgi:hypothetical protein
VLVTKDPYLLKKPSNYVEDKDPYKNSNSLAPTIDRNLSIAESIQDVSDFLQNEHLSAKGPHNIKEIIVNKSRFKELSNVLPRRSQANMRSALEQFYPSERYQANKTKESASPERINSKSNSQLSPLRLAKINSFKIVSQKTYEKVKNMRGISSQLDNYKSNSVYEDSLAIESVNAKNPSALLDRHFKLNRGKKYENMVNLKHTHEESNIQLPKKESTVLLPHYSNPSQLLF